MIFLCVLVIVFAIFGLLSTVERFIDWKMDRDERAAYSKEQLRLIGLEVRSHREEITKINLRLSGIPKPRGKK